jgi:hypothetical protein
MPISQSNKYRLGRFLRIWPFLFIIILVSVLVDNYGPDQYSFRNESFGSPFQPPDGFSAWAAQQEIILDQHSHTLFSDGKLTVEQNVLWHLDHGFNVTFFTDHNTIKNSAEIAEIRAKYADRILLIQGIEWTTAGIHMNFLGINEWTERIPLFPSETQIQDAINEAHNQGALVTVNHIPWSLRNNYTSLPTRAQLLAWGVDYIEIVNGDEYDTESEAWCNASGFGKITGTDMHRPKRVNGWTGLNVSEFTEEAVMAQLRDRNTTIFFSPEGSPDFSIPYENPWFEVVKPLSFLGEMFAKYESDGEFDWLGFGVLVLYIVGGFFIVEGFRVANQKIKARKLQKKKIRQISENKAIFP